MLAEKRRLLVSSPGAVAPERIIAKRVLPRLTPRFDSLVQIEPVFWEQNPLVATETLPTPIVRRFETDLVVSMLCARLRTCLPENITRPDGARDESGTELEDAAEEAAENRGLIATR